MPEIDTLLERWSSVGALTRVEKKLLVTLGFGQELTATRWRPAKLSAKAKSALFLHELDHRRWLARPDDPESDNAPEGPILQLLLYQAGHPEGAAALGACGASPDTRIAWDRWVADHSKEFDRLLGLLDKTVMSSKVVKAHRRRFVLGERQRLVERYERLRNELGDQFIAGTVDREASVRQWEHRAGIRRRRNQ